MWGPDAIRGGGIENCDQCADRHGLNQSLDKIIMTATLRLQCVVLLLHVLSSPWPTSAQEPGETCTFIMQLCSMDLHATLSTKGMDFPASLILWQSVVTSYLADSK